MFFKGNTKACIRLGQDRKTFSLMIRICHFSSVSIVQNSVFKGLFLPHLANTISCCIIQKLLVSVVEYLVVRTMTRKRNHTPPLSLYTQLKL